MKLIPLTKGYFAMVDDADFEWLNQWKWFAMVCEKTVYAARTIYGDGRKRVTLRMHRIILDATDISLDVDHKDLDGLNNTRENIRLCTRQQNARNSGSHQGSSSRFKGVTWHKPYKKWLVQSTLNGKKTHLGYFDIQEDAARAYNQYAKDNHGDYARYNDVHPAFPERNHMVKRISKGSAFRGVSLRADKKMWVAQIYIKGKQTYLGSYLTPIEAAKKYDQSARQIIGRRVVLNFPDTP